ncbi:hypothetical protein Acr_20g0007330 [Actinidia rufa]|uniref:Uncharacterized protein n=1 Tax=Actinidia rufa TaxID=165716 RepID=A0A7J0GDV5_9ERIC|nr:hypothetical protein Acr_20g0007330 [Actinidia rufa]
MPTTTPPCGPLLQTQPNNAINSIPVIEDEDQGDDEGLNQRCSRIVISGFGMIGDIGGGRLRVSGEEAPLPVTKRRRRCAASQNLTPLPSIIAEPVPPHPSLNANADVHHHWRPKKPMTQHWPVVTIAAPLSLLIVSLSNLILPI